MDVYTRILRSAQVLKQKAGEIGYQGKELVEYANQHLALDRERLGEIRRNYVQKRKREQMRSGWPRYRQKKRRRQMRSR